MLENAGNDKLFILHCEKVLNKNDFTFTSEEFRMCYENPIHKSK